MITDFFDGTSCQHCGYTFRVIDGEPLYFRRVMCLPVDDSGIDYLYQCGQCGGLHIGTYQVEASQ